MMIKTLHLATDEDKVLFQLFSLSLSFSLSLPPLKNYPYLSLQPIPQHQSESEGLPAKINLHIKWFIFSSLPHTQKNANVILCNPAMASDP